jgi:SAM-dependent methyltransferase
MKGMDDNAKNLYSTDEYIIKHPSLHKQDSPWKVSKIIPLVDKCIRDIDKKQINLLDIGGGAGLILNAVSAYIEQKYCITVNKFALDLSPGMLEIQKKNNPDLKRALNEDIRKTSLCDKEIDVTMMIDLLEHVPDPAEALKETRRISEFVLLKVPLENNLFLRIKNFVKKGKTRQYLIESSGHINVYDFRGLKKQIENNLGQVVESYFTNVFDYYLSSGHYKKQMRVRYRLMYFVASCMFRLSPRLCSLIFCDFVMILVKCS